MPTATPRKRTTPAKKTAAKKATTAARSATARKVAVPQDHRPPAEVVEEKAAPNVVTVHLLGRDWKIDEAVADDFELLDDLNALEQKNDMSRLPSCLRRLLGEDQYQEAVELLRDKETGRVTLTAASEFMYDLFKDLNPNSSSS